MFSVSFLDPGVGPDEGSFTGEVGGVDCQVDRGVVDAARHYGGAPDVIFKVAIEEAADDGVCNSAGGTEVEGVLSMAGEGYLDG